MYDRYFRVRAMQAASSSTSMSPTPLFVV